MTSSEKDFDKYVKGFTGVEWFDFSDFNEVSFNMLGSKFDLTYTLEDLRIYEMPGYAWATPTDRIDPSLGLLRYEASGVTTITQNMTWSMALGSFNRDGYGLATIGRISVSGSETIAYTVPQPASVMLAISGLGTALACGCRHWLGRS